MNVRSIYSTAVFSALVAGLWIFPKVWYTQIDEEARRFWLAGGESVEGWTYESVPVSESAERVLVADDLLNGEFHNDRGAVIRVFSARRYAESANEIGLFVHTPDRCWTESGWKLVPSQPEWIEVEVHGVSMVLERRLFEAAGNRELVYFGGCVGGQPLPYRLDHNLSVGMKHALAEGTDAGTRATDRRFWGRIWDGFRSRRPLIGPKQFVRISTPVGPGREAEGDERLREFLAQWLTLEDYDEPRSGKGAAEVGSEGEGVSGKGGAAELRSYGRQRAKGKAGSGAAEHHRNGGANYRTTELQRAEVGGRRGKR